MIRHSEVNKPIRRRRNTERSLPVNVNSNLPDYNQPETFAGAQWRFCSPNPRRKKHLARAANRELQQKIDDWIVKSFTAKNSGKSHRRRPALGINSLKPVGGTNKEASTESVGTAA